MAMLHRSASAAFATSAPSYPPSRFAKEARAPRLSRSARVLIVEDDFFVAGDMEAALRDAGFDIAGTASTAEEAENYAESERPDLVVMDIRLGGKRDGIDAALEIFRVNGIRSLFASAHADPRTKARAEAAEPLGWLAKPYTMDALVAQVRAALEQIRI